MHLIVKNSFDSKTKQDKFEKAQCLSDMETIPAVQHEIFDNEDKIMGLHTECRHVNNKVKIQVFHNYSKIIASDELPKNCTPHQLLKTIQSLILKKSVNFMWANQAEIIDELYSNRNIEDLPKDIQFHYYVYLLGRKIINYCFQFESNSNGETVLSLYQEDVFKIHFPIPKNTSPKNLPDLMEELLWKQIS